MSSGSEQLYELRNASCLIQWALRPHTHPTMEPEYRELLAHYHDYPLFRDTVQAIADGLGLHILKVSTFGMVLVPSENSVFAVNPLSYRSSGTTNERLIDGLIQVAIIATIYPNAQDLEDDAMFARPPITVDDVEATLQNICNQLEESARRQPDPLIDDLEAGLYEAWRVYRDKAQTKTTEDGRTSPATIRGMISRGLDFLERQGCLKHRLSGELKQYRPTWRYQTLVQEWSVQHIYAVVHSLLNTSLLEAE
ncbi:MAG TPA: hypothetical protein VGL94_03780 [Ktedonobacteraceae bacterium]